MIYPYMLKPKEQLFITEAYVSSPPACWIHDERGDVFTLGTDHGERLFDDPRGEYSFAIMHNGHHTGTYGSRIERRNGKIRVFTKQGWKIWSGVSFV